MPAYIHTCENTHTKGINTRIMTQIHTYHTTSNIRIFCCFWFVFVVPYLRSCVYFHPPGRRRQFQRRSLCGCRRLSGAPRRPTGGRCTYHWWRSNPYPSGSSGRTRSHSGGLEPDSQHLRGQVWTMTKDDHGLINTGGQYCPSIKTSLRPLIWWI